MADEIETLDRCPARGYALQAFPAACASRRLHRCTESGRTGAGVGTVRADTLEISGMGGVINLFHIHGLAYGGVSCGFNERSGSEVRLHQPARAFTASRTWLPGVPSRLADQRLHPV